MAENVEGGALARKIVDLLAEKQATDILLLDIRELATFADYFVIASANSERQLGAILDTLDDELKPLNARRMKRQGEAQSGWILLDLGDIILHLFQPQERAYYNLEGLWHMAKPVVRIQ